MSYSPSSGWVADIRARALAPTPGAASSTSGRIAQPAGTVVGGAATPTGPVPIPGTFQKTLLWAGALGVLVLGGVMYYRKRRRAGGAS